jgi:hypothetical protein
LHYLRVQERDSVGNWSAAGEITFNAYHFIFLRCLADSEFVLTLAADTAHLQLTRRILKPKDDSELALQQRQLWERAPQTGIAEAFAWSNRFYHVDLQYGAEGAPVAAAGFTKPQDSAKAWNVSRIIFVGGEPPPYYHLFSLGTHLAITAGGAVPDESSPITLEQDQGSDPKQLWLIQPFLDKWWLL